MEAKTFKERFRVHIHKHAPVSDDEFGYIMSYFRLAELRKKTYLLLPSQSCKYEGFVVKGLFQSNVVDERGEEHTLCFPHENWWVGDFNSFRSGQPSNMSILALEDSFILKATKESFDKLMETSSVFERYIRRLTENSSIAFQERVIQNLSNNAEERYRAFRSKYPSLVHRLSQKRIAGFLGVTPEYFSQMVNRIN